MSDQPAPSTAAPAIDRKVWVPMVAMIITFIISTVIRGRGFDLPPGVEDAISGLVTIAVGGIVGWITPMSRAEITGRMTNSLVAEAQADPESKVDLSKIIDDEIIMQAQVDPASAATMPEGETVKSLTEKIAVEKLKPEEKV